MNGFHGKFLHISVSKQSLGQFGLVLHHIPTSPENFADSDLHHPSHPGLESASLLLDPGLLHLRRLILVVVASLEVGVHLLHPLFSVFTGLPIDPESFHAGPLNSLVPGNRTHPGNYLLAFVSFSSDLSSTQDSYISPPLPSI